MRIRFAVIAGTLALYSVALAAQSASPQAPSLRWEAATTYDYTHSNAPTNVCGCFSLQGGSVSVAYHLAHHWNGTGEFAGSHAGSINGRTVDVTLLTYLGGVRYVMLPSARTHPFGQVQVGGVHAGGALYSPATNYTGSNNRFAMTAGGGMDVDLNSRVSLRLIQADYMLTLLPNGSNDHQNLLRVGTGIAIRF